MQTSALMQPRSSPLKFGGGPPTINRFSLAAKVGHLSLTRSQIIDRQIEESVPEMDRPVCLDFLRGYCPNPKCLNRHEDDGSVIAPPARTTIPKDPKVAKKAEATFPQKRAMNRIGVQGKRVNRSNAQQVARPHGLPIPMHPADILKAKGPGAQESSDSGSGRPAGSCFSTKLKKMN